MSLSTADSRIAEGFSVRARAGDYRVDFVDDAAIPMRELATSLTVLAVDPVVAALRPELVVLWRPEHVVRVEATEANKSLDGCAGLLRTLVERGIRRDVTLVALGGGIVQDITAFSASVLYRGIQWAFVPTTLLAQADSCIGSKTSINLGETKNVLGNFHAPARVIIEAGFLDSLSDADIESGIGEMLHYFVYADSPLLLDVTARHAELVANRRLLRPFITESLRIKREVVEIDELDQQERNKFNYGHTFGHAIEAASDFAVRHGHAVTVGMDIANYVSVAVGLMPAATFDRLHALLRVNFPRYDFSQLDLDRYLAALTRDKKNTCGHVACILARAPGALIKYPLPLAGTLADSVRAYFMCGLWHR
jgi:3-dehydroquinate synthase